MPQLTALRAALLDFIGDPFQQPIEQSLRYIPDGLLILQNGKIHAIGTYSDLRPQYPHLPLTSYPGMLLTPGFIDTHIHYPQTEMIAAYGEQLLEWLDKYTFPTERKFRDKTHAHTVAHFFLDELLRHGTTTALVLATVHPESVEVFFEAAAQRNLCMIAGKVLMDCHAPEDLLDTAETAYHDSKRLIQSWHHRDRLRYAITPRFAITSTQAQLEAAGHLLQEFPDVYLHTHLSENTDEVAFVQTLFPHCTDYLDIYDRAGLVTNRAIFAHGVQLSDREFQRLSEAGSTIAFCPTSNLFLGSGLFRLEQALFKTPVKLGLATDMGAGTSFSMLHTAGVAYQIAQLRRQALSPFQMLYLATLGSARALSLDDRLGNFTPGKDADFIVMDPRATPLLAFRNPPELPDSIDRLSDLLFNLTILGDDRTIRATYILGEKIYDRPDVLANSDPFLR